jgi:NAD+ diphosphatase
MGAKFCQNCGGLLVMRQRDGIDRMTCPDTACGYVHWDNPVPVVAGIVEHNGNIVLVQNVGWPKEWFGLVTGFLEKGETPEQGIVREVQEELGLGCNQITFIGNYTFKEKNELIIAFHLIATGEIAKGDELAAFKSVPINKVKPWPFATGLALSDWLKSREVE